LNNSAIKIENVSFAIGSKEILRDVSFSVVENQRISIIGPNGSGKTTLLRCLDKILTGYKGDITVDGRNLQSYNQKQLARALAYVPQSMPNNVPFTVREFIMMARYPHLSPFSVIDTEDERIVNETMEMTETANFADRRLATLSGGEFQRVNIAAAVAQQSKILLLDEPATFLDYKHQEEIQTLLERINTEQATTTVSVTHDINTAAMFSDAVIAIKNGQVVFNGKGEDVMNNEILKKIYEKEFIFVEHPHTGQKLVIPGQASQ